MTDQQDRALIEKEPVFKQFERFRIKVVGRLIEDEHVRWHSEELRQEQAIAFPAGEGADGDMIRSGEKRKS